MQILGIPRLRLCLAFSNLIKYKNGMPTLLTGIITNTGIKKEV